jgi:hypothetical protein
MPTEQEVKAATDAILETLKRINREAADEKRRQYLDNLKKQDLRHGRPFDGRNL